ncbi:hypothetical protein HCG64_01520 [Coprobacillus sp. K06]|uniref:hypothetical protein n=1 Tax=Coprobacillus sp. K06 TaxID=2718930 RepID=UPI001C8C31F8|nr:hypothetical protein [Coprobacillus sp. K06]MBX9163772.1 hypothetical protein [Coprobacillus sp. K06]
MDIDSLKASKKTDQLFLVCVDHYDTSHATFYYYKKEEKWELVLQTPALIGQRGMGEGKEGARQTPIVNILLENSWVLRQILVQRWIIIRLLKMIIGVVNNIIMSL